MHIKVCLQETSHNNRVTSLDKTVKDLLEFKVKSEPKIIGLQQEVIFLNKQ